MAEEAKHSIAIEPTTHELKTWPRFFDAIWTGRKRFEIRRNDRGYQEGDLLMLREWMPGEAGYSGNWIAARVTYVMTELEFGVAPGFVLMSINVEKKLTASRKREHYPPMILSRIPKVLERLRASKSGYLRTTKIGQADRAAMLVLIEEQQVEIFESPTGRAYREKKR